MYLAVLKRFIKDEEYRREQIYNAAEAVILEEDACKDLHHRRKHDTQALRL